jgi:hypothetical protein
MGLSFDSTAPGFDRTGRALCDAVTSSPASKWIMPLNSKLANNDGDFERHRFPTSGLGKHPGSNGAIVP